MTYLDAVSLEALHNFRPLLDVPDDTMQRLRYEFTVMPPRGVVITSLLWSLMYLGFTIFSFIAIYDQFAIGLPLTIFVIIQGLITYATGSVIYYHSIRQLTLVNRTVGLVDIFDLFRFEPAYAFSVLTSRTGVCWIILLSLTLLFFPIELAPGPVLVLLGLQSVLAIAAFVLPLRMVNRCLVLEKRRLLSALDHRLKSILIRLHNAVDEESLEPAEVEVLNHALAGLTTEREIVSRIPTWPWRPGLLGGFLSIAVLPIILFIVQLALEKWLGW